MSNQQKIYLGKTLKHTESKSVEGGYVYLHGESFYKIANYDQMEPFFISVVSDSDHWMFISTTGGLTAGRKNADNALFPYETEDKITASSESAGSKTALIVHGEDAASYWEPFTEKYSGVYAITRNLYKNVTGNRLVFEEQNHDLGIVFQYMWSFSEQLGFIKTSRIINKSYNTIRLEILDGIQNILPYGVYKALQQEYSCLVDAYKKCELEKSSGLGVYSMSSILVDRAEPSEALSATTVWSYGLENAKILLSSTQFDNFGKGIALSEEYDIKGLKGAYFVNSTLEIDSGKESSWYIVAEINQGPASVSDLRAYLESSNAIDKDIESSIKCGTENLKKIVGTADGLQVSEDILSANHHYSNVLFNVMRGGIFDNNYQVYKNDIISFVRNLNSNVLQNEEEFWQTIPDSCHYSQLIEMAEAYGSKDVERLCYEYLPLTFSRRHGDPSRPWNKFAIELKNGDGTKLLNFEGNWRDIFQNWEALSFSIPNFVESMVCKFVNATTADGYNPYRITKKGIDWEILDPEDAWSNIGYWGDHQIIYLLKLLEFSKNYHPGKLREFLTKDIFCYANVPYSIKDYHSLLEDPHNTIDYDDNRECLINERVNKVGSDGKLLWTKEGEVYYVNLTEKLLATLLSKLSNFIPEGGIWMNTQRPEWNDANNALVGFGVSMVTLYYTRRYINFLIEFFEESDLGAVPVSAEMVSMLWSINETLTENKSNLDGKINDTTRKGILDKLGAAAEVYRKSVYLHEFSCEKIDVSASELIAFLKLSLEYVDHTIRANRREDGLYHAYNLMSASHDCVSIDYLYEMLEGQVAVLSSGVLEPEEAVEVLSVLRNSRLYTARQHSYLLYPDRDLKRFTEKNVIPKEQFNQSQLLKRLVEDGVSSVVELDASGNAFYNGRFNNAESLEQALESLDKNIYGELLEKETPMILDTFEQVFNHKSFTGRSGGMYAYEGLGSIYWHMVSKLLLAVAENYSTAFKKRADAATLGKLVDAYYDVRAGIGFNKTPDVYGAFPTDPYSHTPGFSGAKQPGMTGQVKEEVITRLIELGLIVENGKITFNPMLLRRSEFLGCDQNFEFINVDGDLESLRVHKGSLAFTYCQVPVVYSEGLEDKIVLTFNDGSTRELVGNEIDENTSLLIFDKRGCITKIEVYLTPNLN